MSAANDDPVTIEVTGFTVKDALFEDSELAEAAYDVASDIGAALSRLGSMSTHGNVKLTDL